MRIFDYIKQKLFQEIYSDEIDYVNLHLNKWYKPSYNPITKNWYFLCFSKVTDEVEIKRDFEKMFKRSPKLPEVSLMEVDLMHESAG